jgi:hypothetical protein
VSSPVARFTPSRRYLALAIAAATGTVFSVWSALHWDSASLLESASWIARAFNPAASPAWAAPSWFGATWFGATWFAPAWIAAVLFAIPCAVLLALAFRPAIEIHGGFLQMGRQRIPWPQVRRLDQSGWNVPLLVYLTLNDDRRVLIVHPGDSDSSSSLLRHLRRNCREALLDGVPYRQFWGEPPVSSAPLQLAPPRYPLLRPEDEEEIERMFQRLKSVGHLERRDADEE